MHSSVYTQNTPQATSTDTATATQNSAPRRYACMHCAAIPSTPIALTVRIK